ncbi:hypothetical protein HWV62_23288 [Athelia sp. TMB]|nr:hypothetical protein HWV62_23288 [Athelia sp. TMB]
MAPSVSETTTHTVEQAVNGVGKLDLKEKLIEKGPYPFYYPYFDSNEKFPPTEIFEHTDPGSRANPTKPNLLGPGVKTTDVSPHIGTEITGVQISQLSHAGLDELALFAAQRKLLIFRDQDFKDIGPERQIEIARYFGPIQRHPTSGNVEAFPEFHVGKSNLAYIDYRFKFDKPLTVYRDGDNNRFKEYLGGDRANKTSWHSDVSYEKQPPGTTIFFILDQPPSGGDTLFLSQVEAYNRLSPEFKKRLEGLRAVHSAVAQAEHSRKRGGPVRREPVETEHPLVRQHPVTGEKALYVNQGFTRHIVGYKVEESEYLLKFLYDHIAKGSDFQVRATYKPGTVVVWVSNL